MVEVLFVHDGINRKIVRRLKVLFDGVSAFLMCSGLTAFESLLVSFPSEGTRRAEVKQSHILDGGPVFCALVCSETLPIEGRD